MQLKSQFKRLTRRKQRGVSMIDVGIWAAVALGVVMIFVKGVAPVLAQNKARDEITEMAKVVSSIQAKWTNSPNFTGVTLANLIANDVFPPSWVQSATAASNRWGGAITMNVTTMVTAGDSMEIVTAGVPSTECKSIIPGLANTMRVVSVAGTVVKPNGGVVDMAALGTQCNSASNVTITYQLGKN